MPKFMQNLEIARGLKAIFFKNYPTVTIPTRGWGWVIQLAYVLVLAG